MCCKYILCTFVFSPLYTVYIWWTLILHFNLLEFFSLYLYSQGLGVFLKNFFFSKVIKIFSNAITKTFKFYLYICFSNPPEINSYEWCEVRPSVIFLSYPRIIYSKVHSLSTDSSCYSCGHSWVGLSGLSILNHWSICLPLW